jgi:hypothetical protein
MSHINRDYRAHESQVWADIRAISKFEIPEITGLGDWLTVVLSTNSFLFPPPFTPRRIQDSGPVNSPTEVRARALQGADGLGQLSQRAHYPLICLEAYLGHLGDLSLSPFLWLGWPSSWLEWKKLLLRLPRLVWEEWPRSLSRLRIYDNES